jgi:hypothetical protein
MPPMSPDELLQMLKSQDGAGMPIDRDNLTATARLMLEEKAEVFYDEAGRLRVRLTGKR